MTREYLQRLAKFLPPDVGAWDNASNNKWLVAGKGCWVHTASTPLLTWQPPARPGGGKNSPYKEALLNTLSNFDRRARRWEPATGRSTMQYKQVRDLPVHKSMLEISELIASGLTPFEALAAATRRRQQSGQPSVAVVAAVAVLPGERVRQELAEPGSPSRRRAQVNFWMPASCAMAICR